MVYWLRNKYSQLLNNLLYKLNVLEIQKLHRERKWKQFMKNLKKSVKYISYSFDQIYGRNMYFNCSLQEIMY